MKTLHKFKIVYIITALVLFGALLFAAYKFGTLNKQKSYDTQMSGMACGEDGEGCGCRKGDMSCKQKMQSMDNMMGAMKMKHDDVVSEEQFIRDMIPHHQEAVDTSRDVVARSQTPELVQLTQNIIDAQTKEIAMMQGWLKDWYANSTGEANYKNMMPNLAIVSGQSLDHLYLQGMMMHHAGAVAMAEGVLKLNPREEVKTFAQDVIKAQTKEIEIMKNLMMTSMPGMNHKMMGH